MPLVKNYRTYPITRDRAGEFHVLTGPNLEDTRGPFDTLDEAQQWVDEAIQDISERFHIPQHPAAANKHRDGHG